MLANPLKRFFDQAKFKARIWRTLRSGPSELPRPDRIIIDLSHCCDLSCPDCNRSCAVDQAPAALPGCNFPFYILRRLGELQWQPPSWYRPWWPQMKAFALPSYGDGYIRINLQGREPQGIVKADDYDGLCGELISWLKELRDPRSGRSAVKEVIVVSEQMPDIVPDLRPDADLAPTVLQLLGIAAPSHLCGRPLFR